MSRNIEVPKATRYNVSYTITDDDGATIDLTAAEDVYLKVSTEKGGYGETVIDKSAGTVNADGVATWSLTDSDTDLENGLYEFEIEIKYGSDQSTQPEKAKFFVKERVTE